MLQLNLYRGERVDKAFREREHRDLDFGVSDNLQAVKFETCFCQIRRFERDILFCPEALEEGSKEDGSMSRKPRYQV